MTTAMNTSTLSRKSSWSHPLRKTNRIKTRVHTDVNFFCGLKNDHIYAFFNALYKVSRLSITKIVTDLFYIEKTYV